MTRIDRNPSMLLGKPQTRDRKKRQSEHAWWTALDRPTLEELQKIADEVWKWMTQDDDLPGW